jgi:cytochrome P450
MTTTARPAATETTPGPSPSIPHINLDPFDVAHLREPYALHQALRDAGPVVWIEKHGTYGVARHADVSKVLQDPVAFSSSAGVGLAHLRRPGAWREPSPLVESDPPAHTAIRKAMDEILAPSVIRGWRESFAAAADALCGEGVHHCLGQRIARLEAECLLGALVRRVAFFELDGPPVWGAVNMLRTLETLPLRITAS